MDMDSEYTKETRTGGSLETLKKVIKASEPKKLLIAIAIFISLIDVLASLIFPLIAKNLVDSMNAGTFSAAAVFGSSDAQLLFFLLLLGAVASGMSAYLLSKAGMLIAKRLKEQLFSGIIRRPVGYFDNVESGEIVSRFANDTRNISGLVTNNLAGLFEGALMLVGSAILLLALDVKLTLMIFGVILGTFAVMAPVLIKTAKFTEEINDQNAEFGSMLTRVFGEIRLVKGFTAEPIEVKRTSSQLGKIYRQGLRITRIEAMLAPLNGLALTVALLIIFGYGGMRVASGTLTIGTMTAFILYIFNIVVPIIQFSSIFTQYQKARGSSSVLSEMLNVEAYEKSNGSNPTTEQDRGQKIVFDNVKFSYGEAVDENGLDGFDLDGLVVPLGKCTALIGPSGGGKSTVFSLLQRFYSPHSGRILYKGNDIAGFDLNKWRTLIGTVPQGSNLLAGTVLDNVAYGDPEPCMDRAWKALEAANCLDFISGYDDLNKSVGENGILLSGGQKQRIAIARGFYRNPQILLLDEATSALDMDNEASVLEALSRLMKGRTTIVITHRVARLDWFDNVIAIERGRVRHEGTKDIKIAKVLKEYAMSETIVR